MLIAKSFVRLKAGHSLKVSPQMKNILIKKKNYTAEDCDALKIPTQTLS